MDMNNVNIEEIVKQVLSGMTGNAPAQTAAQQQQLLRQLVRYPENSSRCYADSPGTL